MINGEAINGAMIDGAAALDEEAYQLWLRDPAAAVCHLVEIDYNGASAVYPNWNRYTLKLCDIAPTAFGGYYDVVKTLPTFTRQIGEDFTGTVAASIGELVLDNTGGARDPWHNLSLDGQRVRVFHGDPAWERNRFRLTNECLAEIVQSASWDTLTIRLRGISYLSNLPIQTNLVPASTFANAASNQPIPKAMGQVFNAQPACIDEVTQVYQWNDGAVTSVTDVRDSGARFRTSQITISAVNAATDTLSTASAHGFYKDTRVRCDVGTMPSVAGWYGIAWNGSVFCAVAYNSNAAATSPDGITWTAATLPATANWCGVAWNGSAFCAVASTSSIAATSPDGITWTQRALPTSTEWRAIAWNGSVFCAVAYNSSIAATSPDGITWTQRALPTSTGWYAIAWNGSVFCAVAYNSSIAATSPDGITWTQQTLPSSKQWAALAWNGSVFCAVAEASTSAATSPDGVTWTARTLPTSANWGAIAWNGSVFCAVANVANDSATSPDGITWTAGTLPASTNWYAIGWNGSVFCAIGGASVNVTVSTNGSAWSAIANTLPAPLAINTDYWVSATGLASMDFRLAATRGGATINITGTDTGAPLIGYHWTADLATGKVYLDSKPSGALTLDGVAGDLTAGAILPTVLSAVNVDAASKAAFIVTCPQTLGLYIKDRRNRLDVANEIVDGLSAWYGYDRYGMLKFGRIEASYASHDYELVEDDMLFHVITLERMVPPRKRNRLQYRRNWTNQIGALVAGVSAEQRALFSTDYSVSAPQALGADEGTAGQEYHALAVLPDSKPSLMALALDAYTENARLNTLYYGWGAIFSCEVGRIGTEIDIGKVVKVTHSRYGLSGGVRMPVVAIEDKPNTTVLKFFAALAAYAPGQL